MLGAEYLDLGPCPFVSDTFEAIFPFLTSRFGKNVTTDVIFGVHNITQFTAFTANKTDINNETGRFIASGYVDAQVTLRYDDGRNVSVGTAEFHDTKFSAYIN